MPSPSLPFTRRAARALILALIALAPGAAFANVPVVVTPGEQSDPVMVSDGAGGAIVAWTDYRSGSDSDIYAQRIGPDGTPMWTAGGVAVCIAAAFQSLPSIVTDGAGGAILGWTDYRNGNGDVYVQRLSPAGAALWTAGGLPICDDGQPQLGIQLAADSLGGVIAIWEDYRFGPEGDLYAQHVTAAGAPTWGLNGVVVCDAAGTQTSPALVRDGGAGAIAIWRDQRSSGAGDLYAQHLSASGAQLWATAGVPVCTAAGGQYDVHAVGDGAGGVIAVWSDERDAGLADIYAQRIGPGGLPLWAADGVAACSAASYQLFPVVTADGAGGAVVAWEDSRSDTTVDIFAQRIGPDGVSLWETDGLRLCTAGGYESLPSIITDGGGGAIVAWQDQRALGDDVYAQRVNAGGTCMWPHDGLPVSTANDSQLSPVVASDGNGGALFVWYDARSGDWDIWAQHADAWGLLDGTTAVAPAAPGAGLALAPPSPNPSRGRAVIRFGIPEAADVDLALFDAAGRRVRSLAAGPLPAGSHSLVLDPDAGATRLQPGVYFLRLATGGRTIVTRFVAVR